MRIAIIDLGTNTFNLLIADVSGNTSWKTVYKVKEAVKLGEGGITKGFIADEALHRGVLALTRHYERITDYGVESTFAFGTSALRDAKNGNQFISTIKQKFNIDIQIIPGEKEAELIYKGVRQTVEKLRDKYLILDIGGGSNEFIFADNSRIYWKQSFNLGMARLMDQFCPPDPISMEMINKLEDYFESELTPLFKVYEKYSPEIMVGASGSFDTLVRLYSDYPSDESLPPSQEIEMEVFSQLHQKLISSTSAEREQMRGMEPVRRDMIVLSVVFIHYIIKKLGIRKLYQSSYSLKEGALWEIMHNNL